MATIKSFTSLEQSRKLAEILPIESSDMYWDLLLKDKYARVNNIGHCLCRYCVYAWSLTALLNCLREIDFFPNIEVDEHSVIMSISYYNEEEARPLAPVHNVIVEADTFVDACYEMIIRLNELNLL